MVCKTWYQLSMSLMYTRVFDDDGSLVVGDNWCEKLQNRALYRLHIADTAVESGPIRKIFAGPRGIGFVTVEGKLHYRGGLHRIPSQNRVVDVFRIRLSGDFFAAVDSQGAVFRLGMFDNFLASPMGGKAAVQQLSGTKVLFRDGRVVMDVFDSESNIRVYTGIVTIADSPRFALYLDRSGYAGSLTQPPRLIKPLNMVLHSQDRWRKLRGWGDVFYLVSELGELWNFDNRTDPPRIHQIKLPERAVDLDVAGDDPLLVVLVHTGAVYGYKFGVLSLVTKGPAVQVATNGETIGCLMSGG